MKQLFTLFVLVGSSLAARCQMDNPAKIINKENKVISSDILQLSETEFDFGKLPQGKPVDHIFIIKNIGKTPLVLDNVQASCGCTTPQWKKDPIEPGKNSNITVGYNAVTEGPFNKTITIAYNNNQSKIITIKGMVWKTPITPAPLNSAQENLKLQ